MLHLLFIAAAFVAGTTNLYGQDHKISIAETKLVQKQVAPVQAKQSPAKKISYGNYKPFTGKVLGNGVRLRIQADVDSNIIKELSRHDLVVVTGEKNGFYVIEAPTNMNVYIFRSFVLDNFIEGNRVNVRLKPSLSSPVVGYMSTGEQVNGKISTENHKWLEFSPPSSVHFYVAKEYIEKIGGPEMKEMHDKKMANLHSLVEAADHFAQTEMLKPFKEINFQKITENYTNIVEDYVEFPKSTQEAKTQLSALQEEYLNKKIAYLEAKANSMTKNLSTGSMEKASETGKNALTSKDRMRIWERVEEAVFLSWSAHHHNKTMADFYEQEKFKCKRISGIVTEYVDTVKNKPGNFFIRDKDVKKAYIYSTMIDLEKHVGQYVTLQVSERENNNFAFPAYFVMGVE